MDSALDECFDCEPDDLELSFQKAADHLPQITTRLSPEQLLQFYGLYKQSTCGPCNVPKPGFFNTQAKMKWNAWSKLGGMEKLDAMQMYVTKLKEHCPEWEPIAKKKDKSQQWVSVSTHQIEPEEEISDDQKTVFDHVKQRNYEEFRKSCESLANVNELDESGLALIHWATDRNATDILEHLLKKGADVDLQDSEGQTALHYASSCGHLDCLKILLAFGANPLIPDNEGSTSVDVSFDVDVKRLLSKDA